MRLDPQCLPVKPPVVLSWLLLLSNTAWWQLEPWQLSLTLAIVWIVWAFARMREHRTDVFELWRKDALEKGIEE